VAAQLESKLFCYAQTSLIVDPVRRAMWQLNWRSKSIVIGLRWSQTLLIVDLIEGPCGSPIGDQSHLFIGLSWRARWQLSWSQTSLIVDPSGTACCSCTGDRSQFFI